MNYKAMNPLKSMAPLTSMNKHQNSRNRPEMFESNRMDSIMAKYQKEGYKSAEVSCGQNLMS